jgi:hypothetical protein
MDHGLGHGAAQGVVEDRNLHTGHLQAAADDQEQDEEEYKGFHAAIMPHACKAAALGKMDHGGRAEWMSQRPYCGAQSGKA